MAQKCSPAFSMGSPLGGDKDLVVLRFQRSIAQLQEIVSLLEEGVSCQDLMAQLQSTTMAFNVAVSSLVQTKTNNCPIKSCPLSSEIKDDLTECIASLHGVG